MKCIHCGNPYKQTSGHDGATITICMICSKEKDRDYNAFVRREKETPPFYPMSLSEVVKLTKSGDIIDCRPDKDYEKYNTERLWLGIDMGEAGGNKTIVTRFPLSKPTL